MNQRTCRPEAHFEKMICLNVINSNQSSTVSVLLQGEEASHHRVM